MSDTSPKNRLAMQVIVLLPTLAVSFALGLAHVPLVPRLVASLGFGMLMIAGVAYVQRRRQ